MGGARWDASDWDRISTQNQTKATTHRLRYPSITVTWARA